ncbi:hypothetical protein RCM94_25285, partial [Escherichia marmotae]|nr:hypothetical protein [Escherichia marmotae]
SVARGNREQKSGSAGSGSIEQKLGSVARGNREQKLGNVARGNREQKSGSAGSGSIEQKLVSAASVTKEQNYAASAAWKAAAPNILEHLTVNRRSPASAGNALTGCCVFPALPDPVCFREKPHYIKGPEDRGKPNTCR